MAMLDAPQGKKLKYMSFIRSLNAVRLVLTQWKRNRLISRNKRSSRFLGERPTTRHEEPC